MKKKIFIFSLGGNGLEALDCLGDEYELLGFIDDAPEKQGTHPLGFEVFSRNALGTYKEAQLLAVQGSPANFLQRKQIIESFALPPKRFATVIHPDATVSEYTKIGVNCLLMAGVVTTVNSCIGDHVVILPNTTIHHDAQIGDYSLIGSQVVVAGQAVIGENCYIGSGSNIIHTAAIGKNTLIGMGSNVIKDIQANQTVAGNPAIPLH